MVGKWKWRGNLSPFYSAYFREGWAAEKPILHVQEQIRASPAAGVSRDMWRSRAVASSLWSRWDSKSGLRRGNSGKQNLSCPELEFVGKTRAIPTVRRAFSAFLCNKTMEKLIPIAPPAFPHPLSGSSRWVKIPIICLFLFLEDRLGKGGFALPCTPCIPTRWTIHSSPKFSSGKERAPHPVPSASRSSPASRCDTELSVVGPVPHGAPWLGSGNPERGSGTENLMDNYSLISQWQGQAGSRCGEQTRPSLCPTVLREIPTFCPYCLRNCAFFPKLRGRKKQKGKTEMQGFLTRIP